MKDNEKDDKIPKFILVIMLVFLLFVMVYWDEIAKVLLSLPLFIIMIEICFSLYILIERIISKRSFHMKSFLYGLCGAAVGFGIAVILLLMYLIPLSASNNLKIYNEMDSLNGLFYMTILMSFIYSICKY